MMKKTLTVLFVVLTVMVLCLTGCSGSKDAAAPAQEASAPAVSDGSEDLVIDCRVNVAGTDEDNHFYWKGNVRYMAADDSYDSASGASALGSTHLFMMYLYDVEARETMSSGLRGLFLYGVNGADQVANDKLEAFKNPDGSITMQYVHRGTAYRFITDKNGILSLPDGRMESRAIGTPQEIEAGFSTDGTGRGVDYSKVWASDVVPVGANPDSMYFWDGDLEVALDGDVLTITGVLTAVTR